MARAGHGQAGGNTVAEKRVDVAYNALGQFTSIARYKDTDGGTGNEVATSSFTYDTLARLTGLAYSKGGNNLFTPYSWTYDSLSSPGCDGAATALATDPRVAATAAMPAMPSPGRVTQMTSQDGTSDYGYDKTSQLTSAVHSFQTNESHVYDDIHNGLVSPDGGRVVLDFADRDGSGTQPIALAKRYLYGEMVDQILAQEDVTKNLSATDRVLWPLTDNLGTVRDLAKQDGTIAAHYKYDSYGNVTSGDTSLTRYLFASRELDTDTGLQYNRARWYDPAVGRWISEDPLGFVAGDGNVTRYVGNATTNTTDGSGLQPPPDDDDWVYHDFEDMLADLEEMERDVIKSINPPPLVIGGGNGGRPLVSFDFEPFPREDRYEALHSIPEVGKAVWSLTRPIVRRWLFDDAPIFSTIISPSLRDLGDQIREHWREHPLLIREKGSGAFLANWAI